MIKCNIIGSQYIVKVTLDDGTTRTVTITPEQYATIERRIIDGKVPANIHKRVVDWCAGEVDLFDTPSGFLEDGYYSDKADGGYWVKETDKPVGEVDDTGIVNDQLTKTPDYGYRI